MPASKASAAATDTSLDVDAALLQRGSRWSVDDATRQRQQQAQQQLSSMLGQGALTLQFADGRQLLLPPVPRGPNGLGALFWLLAAAALALAAVTAAVLLAHPRWRNLPYAVIGLCQSANLLAIGIESLPGLGLPRPTRSTACGRAPPSTCAVPPRWCICPRCSRGACRMAAGSLSLAWAGCAVLLALAARQALPQAWWWTQASMLACGALTLQLMTWSYKLEPNPFALLLRRLAATATATLLLLSIAVAVASAHEGMAPGEAQFSAIVWYLFLGLLILLLPVFSRVQPLMRELALLGGTCSVALSLHVLLVGRLRAGRLGVAGAVGLCSRWRSMPAHAPGCCSR